MIRNPPEMIGEFRLLDLSTETAPPNSRTPEEQALFDVLFPQMVSAFAYASSPDMSF